MIRSLWKVGALLPVHDHYPARNVSTRCEHHPAGRTVVSGTITAGLSRFITVRTHKNETPVADYGHRVPIRCSHLGKEMQYQETKEQGPPNPMSSTFTCIYFSTRRQR